MSARRILSVGQCGFDHANIARTFRTSFDAEVVPADSADEAMEQLRQASFDLVLVNRVFDRDGTSGLDLVRRLKETPELSQVPVMLVSNFEEAQQKAMAVGALPGFGKSALGKPHLLEQLRPLLQG